MYDAWTCHVLKLLPVDIWCCIEAYYYVNYKLSIKIRDHYTISESSKSLKVNLISWYLTVFHQLPLDLIKAETQTNKTNVFLPSKSQRSQYCAKKTCSKAAPVTSQHVHAQSRTKKSRINTRLLAVIIHPSWRQRTCCSATSPSYCSLARKIPRIRSVTSESGRARSSFYQWRAPEQTLDEWVFFSVWKIKGIESKRNTTRLLITVH